MAGNSKADRLSQLRALAQRHLAEIESDKTQEQVQLSQAEAEIQRYSKISSFDRKKIASAPRRDSSPSEDSQQLYHSEIQTSSDMGVTKQRFKPSQEILHRLKWDPKLNIKEYVVGYLERFEGIKEMPADHWIRDFSDEEWIPMHRVRYIKRVKLSSIEGENRGPELGIVWDRDGRIDKISTNSDFEQSNSTEDVLSIDGTSVTGGMSL